MWVTCSLVAAHGHTRPPWCSPGPVLHICRQRHVQYCCWLGLTCGGSVCPSEISKWCKSGLSPQRASCRTFSRTRTPVRSAALEVSPPETASPLDSCPSQPRAPVACLGEGQGPTFPARLHRFFLFHTEPTRQQILSARPSGNTEKQPLLAASTWSRHRDLTARVSACGTSRRLPARPLETFLHTAASVLCAVRSRHLPAQHLHFGGRAATSLGVDARITAGGPQVAGAASSPPPEAQPTCSAAAPPRCQMPPAPGPRPLRKRLPRQPSPLSDLAQAPHTGPPRSLCLKGAHKPRVARPLAHPALRGPHTLARVLGVVLCTCWPSDAPRAGQERIGWGLLFAAAPAAAGQGERWGGLEVTPVSQGSRGTRTELCGCAAVAPRTQPRWSGCGRSASAHVWLTRTPRAGRARPRPLTQS